jgi:hypothetical protein
MAKIKVGKADVKPDAPAHVTGVHQGNSGKFSDQKGHLPDGRATSRRSTGVNAKKHDVIDPRMPSLPPN